MRDQYTSNFEGSKSSQELCSSIPWPTLNQFLLSGSISRATELRHLSVPSCFLRCRFFGLHVTGKLVPRFRHRNEGHILPFHPQRSRTRSGLLDCFSSLGIFQDRRNSEDSILFRSNVKAQGMATRRGRFLASEDSKYQVSLNWPQGSTFPAATC